MDLESEAFTVTYHDAVIMPDIRCCMNLGCAIQLFSPPNISSWDCPVCGEVSFWKVENLHYVRRKV